MDSISSTNRERWNALANANVEWSRPFLDLTKQQAEEYIYRQEILNDVAGKKVLCLASGGGQDSAAFGLLGADVTVFDLSDIQLERDRQAAEHHGYPIAAIQGDMRDLSAFPENCFDILWQVYSLNFVPSVRPVFSGAARILKPGGIYFLQFANPFVHSIDNETWDGKCYPLQHLYRDGEDLSDLYPDWDVDQDDGSKVKLLSPHEYRHALSTVINTMTACGFHLLGLWEYMKKDESPEPGSWAHFTQVAPPWFSTFWRLDK
jgi:SAM-dependent methyltransferase